MQQQQQLNTLFQQFQRRARTSIMLDAGLPPLQVPQSVVIELMHTEELEHPAEESSSATVATPTPTHLSPSYSQQSAHTTYSSLRTTTNSLDTPDSSGTNTITQLPLISQHHHDFDRNFCGRKRLRSRTPTRQGSMQPSARQEARRSAAYNSRMQRVPVREPTDPTSASGQRDHNWMVRANETIHARSPSDDDKLSMPEEQSPEPVVPVMPRLPPGAGSKPYNPRLDKNEKPSLTVRLMVLVSYVVIAVTAPISLFFCLKVIKEYERLVLFRLGRLESHVARGPGIVFILPCLDTYKTVDLRTVSFDVPPQEILSRDSVTVTVDAVVYFRVSDPVVSVTNVNDAHLSTKLLAQTTMRNVLGMKTLSEMLSERESIAQITEKTLDVGTDPWGVVVERVEMKDIRLPYVLMRAMAAEAEAARDARARIIAADGERRASRSLTDAANVLERSPHALTLRYLQTLTSVAAEHESTILYPLPVSFKAMFSRPNLGKRQKVSDVAVRKSAKPMMQQQPAVSSIEESPQDDPQQQQHQHPGMPPPPPAGPRASSLDQSEAYEDYDEAEAQRNLRDYGSVSRRWTTQSTASGRPSLTKQWTLSNA